MKESSSGKVPFLKWCLRNPVELIGGLIILLLTVVVFLQVLFRYLLHTPLAWSEELAMFVWQWCNFIGAAIAVRSRYHYHIDLLIRRFPDRLQTSIQILSSLLIFGVGYLMIHMGIKMMWMTMDHIYPVLQFPVAYAYLVFPIAGTLMVLYQIPFFLREIRKLRSR